MGHRSAIESEGATEWPEVSPPPLPDAVAAAWSKSAAPPAPQPAPAPQPPRRKVSHIGAPACFALEMACKQILAAFDDPEEHVGIYVVGSCLDRPDWRDVDVRMIMSDRAFARLFPTAYIQHGAAAWEFDPRWTLMTVTISRWLRDQTGLPVDFQFQPMTFANEKHKGRRHALALSFVGPGEGGR